MNETIKQFESTIGSMKNDLERVNENVKANKESTISEVTNALTKVNVHLDDLEKRASSIFIKNEYNESLAQGHEIRIVEISAHLQ